jgi:hypothetical protein
MSGTMATVLPRLYVVANLEQTGLVARDVAGAPNVRTVIKRLHGTSEEVYGSPRILADLARGRGRPPADRGEADAKADSDVTPRST